MTARVFLSHQINALTRSYDVTVITNMTDNEGMLDNLLSEVKIISIPISRGISLTSDIKAFTLLLSIYLKEKYYIVHSVSPKAAILSAVAGYIARIPFRIHTFTGQVWATKKGLGKYLLKSVDKLIVKLNSIILVDSISQREYLIDNRVLKKDTALVLGKGSISGVDTDRFYPSQELRCRIRTELNVANDTVVLLFIGRLKVDKGVLDLISAFININSQHPNTFLVIIGPDEENLQPIIRSRYLDSLSSIKFLPYTNKPEHYMAASDIFVLPSYREGFGSVVIEAAACGVPAAVSRIYGLTDAVEENITGLFFEAGNTAEMEEVLAKLVNNKDLRLELGENALSRVKKHFLQEDITYKLCELYSKLDGRKVKNVV